MSENLLVDIDEQIVIITLNRPKQLNALNTALLLELEAELSKYRNPAAARAIIVTGAGDRAFVAGADIAEMRGFGAHAARNFSDLGQRVFNLLESVPVVTIAAVNGFALGGGCELAIACDLIYASERAKFGQPEVGLGLIPGFGGTQRLPRLVGRQRAREIILTGDPIDAAKAKEIRLALEVLPPDQLLAHCKTVAKKIATRGPLGVAEAKRVIAHGADLPLKRATELEAHAFGVLFDTHDSKEGMGAFLEKRPPQFTGK